MMLAGIKMNKLIRNQRITNLAAHSKFTVSNYIIESLIDKNVKIAFGHKKTMNRYTPLFKTAEEYDNFDIIFENYEETAAYKAVTYSKINKNLGVVINNSPYGFGSILNPIKKAKYNMYPILLLSFFDPYHELKISAFPGEMRSFIKQSITIKNSDNFPAEVEGLLSYCFEHPAGPVHLNISNEILHEPIPSNISEYEENLSLLQYLEKQYEQSEKDDVKSDKYSKTSKNNDHPVVTFSRDVCKMHKINYAKQLYKINYTKQLTDMLKI